MAFARARVRTHTHPPTVSVCAFPEPRGQDPGNEVNLIPPSPCLPQTGACLVIFIVRFCPHQVFHGEGPWQGTVSMHMLPGLDFHKWRLRTTVLPLSGNAVQINIRSEGHTSGHQVKLNASCTQAACGPPEICSLPGCPSAPVP